MKIFNIKYIIVFLLFIIVLISSCATPYQAKGVLGGYASQQIDENTYHVNFHGNQHTSPEKIRTYLFYFCAELTMEKGFKYFYIAKDQSYFKNEVFSANVSQPFKTSASMSGGVTTTVNPTFEQNSVQSEYTAEFIIKMYKVPIPEHKSYLIQAIRVLKDLKIK